MISGSRSARSIRAGRNCLFKLPSGRGRAAPATYDFTLRLGPTRAFGGALVVSGSFIAAPPGGTMIGLIAAGLLSRCTPQTTP
jgi:hypothetical protein